ncbi:MAG TPA: hypothetical protein VK043_04870 [Burkholderiales bacterium]|nr:hypothetical protein [Burkholderiales bacterium]
MIQCLAIVAGLLLAAPAHAYLGPGAGLGMLGSLFAVIGAVLLAILGILILPVRMILKKRRAKQAQPDVQP